MTADDAEQFAVIMGSLAKAFNRELDAATVRLYFLALEHVPVQEVQRRALTHLREAEYFPRPFELEGPAARYRRDLRRRVGETQKLLAGDPPPLRISDESEPKRISGLLPDLDEEDGDDTAPVRGE